MCSDLSAQRIPVLFLTILICSGGALAQSSTAKESEKAFSGTDRELIGLWSGEGEMIEFRPDGTCRYTGELYPYKQSQGHLIIEIPGGNAVFTYQMKAGQLLLTAEGQQSAYSRVPLHPKSKEPTTDMRNPSDLIGQWCYVKSSTGFFTGRCIILSADGTYRFTSEVSRIQPPEMAGATSSQDSDSGTWYVDGDRLYYRSTIHGSGSYQLERRNHPVNVKDPMIVLDNEPFVTTTQRPPWR